MAAAGLADRKQLHDRLLASEGPDDTPALLRQLLGENSHATANASEAGRLAMASAAVFGAAIRAARRELGLPPPPPGSAACAATSQPSAAGPAAGAGPATAPGALSLPGVTAIVRTGRDPLADLKAEIRLLLAHRARIDPTDLMRLGNLELEYKAAFKRPFGWQQVAAGVAPMTLTAFIKHRCADMIFIEGRQGTLYLQLLPEPAASPAPLAAPPSAAPAPATPGPAASPARRMKSRMCEHFAIGRCKYGDRCFFAHCESELRVSKRIDQVAAAAPARAPAAAAAGLPPPAHAPRLPAAGGAAAPAEDAFWDRGWTSAPEPGPPARHQPPQQPYAQPPPPLSYPQDLYAAQAPPPPQPPAQLLQPRYQPGGAHAGYGASAPERPAVAAGPGAGGAEDSRFALFITWPPGPVSRAIMTEENLRLHFSQFGPVASVVAKQSNAGKRFAFVFYAPEGGPAAMAAALAGGQQTAVQGVRTLVLAYKAPRSRAAGGPAAAAQAGAAPAARAPDGPSPRGGMPPPGAGTAAAGVGGRERGSGRPGPATLALLPWACPICTLENGPLLAACDACGGPKPADAGLGVVGPPDSDEEYARRLHASELRMAAEAGRAAAAAGGGGADRRGAAEAAVAAALTRRSAAAAASLQRAAAEAEAEEWAGLGIPRPQQVKQSNAFSALMAGDGGGGAYEEGGADTHGHPAAAGEHSSHGGAAAVVAGRLQDLHAAQDEDVSCPICLEFFADDAVLLECGHLVCRTCLAELLASRNEDACGMCLAPLTDADKAQAAVPA